jgi:hypothetical protein
MRNRLLKSCLFICFIAASCRAFSEPRLAARKATGFQTKMEAIQFSEPRSRGGSWLGCVIGRVTNRIVNGFLSDEHVAKSAVLQVIFLMGLIEIMFSNDCLINPKPSPE